MVSGLTTLNCWKLFTAKNKRSWLWSWCPRVGEFFLSLLIIFFMIIICSLKRKKSRRLEAYGLGFIISLYLRGCNIKIESKFSFWWIKRLYRRKKETTQKGQPPLQSHLQHKEGHDQDQNNQNKNDYEGISWFLFIGLWAYHGLSSHSLDKVKTKL